MESDAEGGDQDYSCKVHLESFQEYFGLPTDPKVAGVLKAIWGKAKWRDAQKEELKILLIHENCIFMEIPLLNLEIYKKKMILSHDSVIQPYN